MDTATSPTVKTQEELDEMVCRMLHDEFRDAWMNLAAIVADLGHAPEAISRELAERGLRLFVTANDGPAFCAIEAAARHMYRIKEA